MPAPWDPVNPNGDAGADAPLDNLLSELLGDWTPEADAAPAEDAEPAAISAAEMLLRLTGEPSEPDATPSEAAEALPAPDPVGVELLARALRAEEPAAVEAVDEPAAECLSSQDETSCPGLDLSEMLGFRAPADVEEPPPSDPEAVSELAEAQEDPGAEITDQPGVAAPVAAEVPAEVPEPDDADAVLASLLDELASAPIAPVPPAAPVPLPVAAAVPSVMELPALASIPNAPAVPAAAETVPSAPVSEPAPETRRRCTAAHAYALFYLGADTLAIDAAHVIQVERVPRVTPVPGCASFVRGIVSLRGEVLPLLDLSLLLGHEHGIDPEEGRLVVVRMLTTGAAAALLVERLGGVVYAVPEELGPPEATHDPGIFPWLQAHAGQPSRPFQVLDLARILNHAEERQRQEGDALWAEPQTKE